MSDEQFRPTTEPNTPERWAEAQEWMVRRNQAAVDKLVLSIRESADKARTMLEGIRLVEEAFEVTE